MKYTELPPGHSWNNPENAPPPPDGWRYCLEAEVHENQNWVRKSVPCRCLIHGSRWSSEDEMEWCGNSLSWSYIVPDSTPFDIPQPADSSPVVGITLRQHYAGLAMQGILSGGEFHESRMHAKACVSLESPTQKSAIAWFSVQMADTLIAALEKKEMV